MRGQTSTEYLLLVSVSIILALIAVLGVGTYFSLLEDLSEYLKLYTVNVGVDIYAGKKIVKYGG